ncbi:polysaccharide biosynthesis/export family protein [Planctomycetota bacterium]|nr:polysaccharide biosynthesis/export family protein [Planctomycetota bacterium]
MRRFVLSVAATWLLLLGCSATPETFTPVETMTTFPHDPYVYRIAPGDEIEVLIEQDPDYADVTTVLPDGHAVFKYVGEMDVYGNTLQQTTDKLRKALERYYNNPTMTMRLKRTNGPDPIVYIGAFSGSGDQQNQNAGSVSYRRGIGLMEALALCGGLSEPDVDVAEYIYVVRNIKSIDDRKVYRFDLAAAVRGASPDLPLHPGDVMFVDNSWLQNLGRAVDIFGRVVGTTANGLSSALVIDTLADRN